MYPVQTWRKRVKQLLVECLGGKCNKCSYNNCLAALDFHHLRSKDSTISQMTTNPKSLDKILKEARKCIVLCCRCHTELHSGLWSIHDIEPFKFQEPPPKQYQKNLQTGNCPVCNKPVFGTTSCSRSCAAKMSCKIDWPEPQQVLRMVNETSFWQTGIKLGVSDNSVRKYLKKHNLL